jgi:hypothetical protein
MITLTLHADYLSVAVFNQLTLADVTELETRALQQAETTSRIQVLVDLTDMVDYTFDAALEELRFARTHGHSFGKVAIVTGENLPSLATWLTRWLSNAEVRQWASLAEAHAWMQNDTPAEL